MADIWIKSVIYYYNQQFQIVKKDPEPQICVVLVMFCFYRVMGFSWKRSRWMPKNSWLLLQQSGWGRCLPPIKPCSCFVRSAAMRFSGHYLPVQCPDNEFKLAVDLRPLVWIGSTDAPWRIYALQGQSPFKTVSEEPANRGSYKPKFCKLLLDSKVSSLLWI